VVVLASELAETVGKATGKALGAPLLVVKGKVFDRLAFQHPLYDRPSIGVLADYVTLEAGTGVVHTAPGHGSDDYVTGVRYGLDVYAPVGPGGHYTDDVLLFAGLQVWAANPKVEEALHERARLWHRADFGHSYPHCWRCHNPVIFLATSQWFIGMDRESAAAGGKTLRAQSLEAIKGVEWVPAWGQERIHNMLANRPDWCISRQRSWGVPIPALACQTCQHVLMTPELVERAAGVFDVHGADSWYERPLEEFVPEGTACPSCGGTAFDRETNILDVWFDSGSSHEAVLAQNPGLTWPAAVYLEGSDQYRGWFQTSLLVGLGTRQRAPFERVITHGFVVATDGRKMSKSLGNTVVPQDVIKQHGAEIIRLWAAMVEYREEVRLGKEILARVVEAYRKLRNTLRFLAGNLYDFDPARDRLPKEKLQEVDRYVLARYAAAAAEAREAYDTFDFQAIVHTLTHLATVDISAFYSNVSKDCVYTLGPASQARRSAQTAMYVMVDGICRLLAPILPITADELWRVLPGQRETSVHLALLPADAETWRDDALVDRWTKLIAIRDVVNGALETQRQAKTIGTSLEARIVVSARGETLALLRESAAQLDMLFIVSGTEIREAGADGPELTVDVVRTDGTKCIRCWRYVHDISTEPAFAGLCGRCVEAVAELV
jgi:isoleucyl-tRNA synthetase